jgi:hypothetical protein
MSIYFLHATNIKGQSIDISHPKSLNQQATLKRAKILKSKNHILTVTLTEVSTEGQKTIAI